MFSRLLSTLNPFASKVNTSVIKCQEEVLHAIYLPQHKVVIGVTRSAFECFSAESFERKWFLNTTTSQTEVFQADSYASSFVKVAAPATNVNHICATMNHDLNYIITGDDDNCIRIYEVLSGATGVRIKFILGRSDQFKTPSTPSSNGSSSGADDAYSASAQDVQSQILAQHESKKIIEQVEMDSKLTGHVSYLLCVGPDLLLSGTF